MRYLYTILAFTAWGVNSTLVLRALGERGVPGPVSTFCGTVVAAFIMLMIIGARGRMAAAELLLTEWRRLVLQALAFSFTSMTYQLAVLKTSVANAALTHSLQPVFTCMLFAPLFMKQRPSRLESLAVAVGLGGMIVLLAPQLSWDGKMEGILYGTLSAVCYSCSLLNIKSFPKETDQRVLIATILMTSWPVLLPFALHAGFPEMSGSTLGLLVLFGAVGFAGANVLFFAALKRMKAGHMAALSYLEPVVAIGAGALWLGEPITAHAFVGGALILGSSGIIAYDDLSHGPR